MELGKFFRQRVLTCEARADSLTLPMEPIIHILCETIAHFNMIRHGDRLLVGVSGGPDSVALLHLMGRIAVRYGLTLGVAHLNHQLRGAASDADAELVESLAINGNLSYYGRKEDVAAHARRRRLCLEEGARQVRYAFLEEVADRHGYHKIAVGHHADDNAEQVLLNLIRGSGMKGLAGIPPVRNGRIIRPLIRLSRDDILKYVADNRLSHAVDASNADPRFRRNRLRHQALPLLERHFNPEVAGALNRLSEIVRDENEWTEAIVRREMARIALNENDRAVTLSVKAFSRKHPALKRRLIRGAIHRLDAGAGGIHYAHIEAARRLADAAAPTAAIHLPRGIMVRRDQDRLVIERSEAVGGASDAGDRAMADYAIAVPEPTGHRQVHIPETGAILRFTPMAPPFDVKMTAGGGRRIALFDAESLSYPLVIRNLLPGDRFVPFGMTGRQKASRAMINRKIPKSLRRRLPILVSGDLIIWVAGVRRAEGARLTEQTAKALKVELFLA